MRNRVIGSVAAVLLVVGSVITFGLLRNGNEATPPVESPLPSMSTSPSPSASATPDPVIGDLRNATLNVPAFPGSPDCKAGTRRFVAGEATVGEGNISTIVLRQIGTPVLADVDSVPGSEALFILECREYSSSTQLLAVKVSPAGELSSLGWVLNSPDHSAFEVDSFTVSGGQVFANLLSPGIPDGGHNILDLQTRVYQYSGGQFRQVSGPVRFATPPSDPKQTDFRNCTIEIGIGAGRGKVRTQNGTGQVTVAGTTYSLEVKSVNFFTGNTGRTNAVALFELRTSAGAAIQVINVYSFTTPVPADHFYVALESGKDGIVAISKVEQSGKQSKVTVVTAAGSETRTYQETTSGTVGWQRVS